MTTLNFRKKSKNVENKREKSSALKQHTRDIENVRNNKRIEIRKTKKRSDPSSNDCAVTIVTERISSIGKAEKIDSNPSWP